MTKVQAKKAKNLQGKPRIGIVASRFNDFITRRLLVACQEELVRLGVGLKDQQVFWVPGAFELPLAAQKLAVRRDTDAVIALGAVLRGETFHFELVAQAAADGILKVGLETGKPVIFGVLTTETTTQAYARAQKKGDNKGRDSAQAAMEMIEVLKKVHL